MGDILSVCLLPDFRDIYFGFRIALFPVNHVPFVLSLFLFISDILGACCIMSA